MINHCQFEFSNSIRFKSGLVFVLGHIPFILYNVGVWVRVREGRQ